jgi:hypothetical protein
MRLALKTFAERSYFWSALAYIYYKSDCKKIESGVKNGSKVVLPRKLDASHKL